MYYLWTFSFLLGSFTLFVADIFGRLLQQSAGDFRWTSRVVIRVLGVRPTYDSGRMSLKFYDNPKADKHIQIPRLLALGKMAELRRTNSEMEDPEVKDEDETEVSYLWNPTVIPTVQSKCHRRSQPILLVNEDDISTCVLIYCLLLWITLPH